MQEAHDMGIKLAVLLWHAAWPPMAEASVTAVRTLAEQHPHIMFLILDVEASPENRKFALEKVRSVGWGPVCCACHQMYTNGHVLIVLESVCR